LPGRHAARPWPGYFCSCQKLAYGCLTATRLMHSRNEHHSERINLRTTPTVKRLLQQAAAASHKDLSEFILEHAIVAAARILADRRLFLLDEGRWQQLLDALEHSPKDRPRLKQLFTEPGLLD